MSESLVIIGGGPAGLAAAAAGRELGHEPLILEQANVYGGAWATMPPTLKCLSFREHDVMPDGSTPRGKGNHALVSEVLATIQAYGKRAGFRTEFATRVTGINLSADKISIQTDGSHVDTHRMVVAAGEFERPFIPALEGEFHGVIEHTRTFDAGAVAPGEVVVVAGTGNSGIEAVSQLLSAGAQVKIANRSPIKRPIYMPDVDSLLGKVSFALSAIPITGLPMQGGCTHKTPPHDGILFDSVAKGRVEAIGEVVGLWDGGVVVSGGRQVECQRIVMATGYRRNNAWLSPPLTLNEQGVPLHRAGVSTECSRIGFMGIPCMRTRRSGFLRGFTGDARAVVGRLE